MSTRRCCLTPRICRQTCQPVLLVAILAVLQEEFQVSQVAANCNMTLWCHWGAVHFFAECVVSMMTARVITTIHDCISLQRRYVVVMTLAVIMLCIKCPSFLYM